VNNILEKISELAYQAETYISALTIEKIGIFVSIISGVATIIASIIAVYTIKIWRRQQLYGKRIDAIFELHDSHEILTGEYMIAIKNFLYLSKAAKEEQNNGHKIQINQRIRDEIDKTIKRLPDIEYKYQISLFRAARISNQINPKDSSLDYEFIRNTFDDLFIKVPKHLGNDDFDKFITLFSEKFSTIKTDAKKIFDAAQAQL
jgi:hypothetical protein